MGGILARLLGMPSSGSINGWYFGYLRLLGMPSSGSIMSVNGWDFGTVIRHAQFW